MASARGDVPHRHGPHEANGPARHLPTAAHPIFVVPALALLGAVFAGNVAHHAFIGDDAFISFRYARHLADGLGLVWNPGERVEGYTNFSWVLLLAAGMRMGLDPQTVANLVGTTCGAGLLGLLLVFGARLYGWRSPWAWFAPLLLATSRSYAAWCTGGLETTAFALLVFSGLVTFIAERDAGRSLPLASSGLFALATLTRPEGGMFFAAAVAVMLIDVSTGRRKLGQFLGFMAPWVLVVGAHLAWRVGYYGDWLPNTFRAKVPGLWWEQGLTYLNLFARDYRLFWFLPLAALALWGRHRFVATWFGSITVTYLLWLAAIGGDRFEFRLLLFVFPLGAWLLTAGLHTLAHAGLAGSDRSRVAGVAAALLAVALLATVARTALIREPDRERHGVASVTRIEAYASRRVQEGRLLRGLIERSRLPEDLVIAVGGAGAVPYWTRWPTVDRRGLNDRWIARQPLTSRGIVGHERDAPLSYLEARGVTIFDVFNRIVHPCDTVARLPTTVPHDGKRLPVRTLRVDGHCLAFASLVTEAEFRRAFAQAEWLR